MRRQDKALSDVDIIKILNQGEYGVLATVDSDGQPYGVPLNYVYIDGDIYFHCALEGHKLDNIACNDKVSFSVVGRTEVLPAEFSTGYESVIAFGTAAVISGDERYRGLMALAEKYSPDYLSEASAYIEKLDKQTAVVRFSVDRMTGKARITENM